MNRFRTGTSALALLPPLLSLLLLTSCGGDHPDAPASGPRNVVLFVVDTLRADRLGCYGYDRGTTPAIDALAASGTTYENARSQGSNTRYSMISMLSGLYVTEEEERLPVDFPTLAESVRKSGKATAAFIGNPLLVNGSRGFERGFDHVEGPEIEGQETRLNGDAGAMAGKFAKWYREHRDELREGPGFFAWVHAMDPHVPYVVPEADRLKAAGPLPGEARLRETWAGAPPSALAYLSPRDAANTERSMQVMLAENHSYDAELVGLDASLAELVAFLKEQGEFDDTLIVFAADHGELLYDRLKYPEEARAWFNNVKDTQRRGFKELYFSGHGWSFHEPQWHIPLILAGPGVPAGVRQPALVANVDIFPTVLEACGLQPPEILPGRSLSGGAPGRHAEVYAYSIYTSAVLDERGWKYVDRRGRLPERLDPEDVDPEADGPAVELFNLHDDPYERDNLYLKLPKQAEYFAAMIDGWRKQNRHATDTTLTDADREAMQALGYVGDDAPSR